MSKSEARKKNNDDLNSGKLLNEIEAISKALYLDKNPSKSSSSIARNRPKSVDGGNALLPNLKSKRVTDDPSSKDKKSFWNWKPLKALSQVRNRRFNCCFTLEVHKIEGLPTKFSGLSLSVHWKRRDGEVVTSPIKVVEGVAEFEEKLIHTCSVYGSRSGPHHSAKYDAKHFLLYAAVLGNPKLDLGKHRVDLTRLLPLKLEELEDEKSSGTWTTSFKLSGEAKGAVMNVSFGYVVLGDSLAPNNKNVPQLLESKSTINSRMRTDQYDGKGSIRRVGSLPTSQKQSMTSRSMNDIKILREVAPVKTSEFSNSVKTLREKFDEEKSVVDEKCEIAVSLDGSKPLKPASCSPSDSSKGHMVDENDKRETAVSLDDTKSLKPASSLSSDSSKGHIVDENDKCEIAVSLDDTKSLKPASSLSSDSSKGHIIDGNGKCDIHSKPLKPASSSPSDSSKGHTVDESEDAEFSVIEKRMESFAEKLGLDEDKVKDADELVVKSTDLPVVPSSVEDGAEDGPDLNREKNVCSKESLLEDLESALSHVADLEKEGLDTPDAKSESSNQENQVEEGPNDMTQTLNLDDLTDSVADEFLSMLGVEDAPFCFSSDAEPDSPRERLLREFQKEAEASGCSLFGFDIDEETDAYYDEDVEDYDYYAPTISGWEGFSEEFDSLPVGEPEYPKIRAKVMEDLETQVLMEEWGLNENAFHSSPPNSSGGFGSPIDLPHTEPSPLPPLAEGLGPFIQTKTGGFLGSMNPALFRSSKTGGSLIMQVSSPVVVPAVLGSEVMEILKHLASVGLEKLSVQANKLMPLEDITGKTMEQIAWEALPGLEASERKTLAQTEQEGVHISSTAKKRSKGASASQKSKKSTSSAVRDDVDSEYVSLEDLAPLAMDKIEALSIEGLRIQSGMSDEEAPSNISAQSIGEFSALEGRSVNSTGFMGLEGAVGLQLLALEDSAADGTDGLIGLSLTLDEWMRLDSGEIDEEEQMSERTSKLLAAHHAKCTDLNFLGKKKQGKASGSKCGLLGNNFTVALMVQLRDPLRNYEPVGMPMLALIQVERVFLPPKPKIYGTVAQARDCNDEDDELELVAKEDTKVEPKEEKIQEQELTPQYKISEVHVAGLKSEPGKKKLWGSAAQQQSGSRWLLANGMGKNNKHPFMKSKSAAKSPLPATVTAQPGDTLWSISARFHGTGAKWKELAALNPHIRNPNVIVSNETIKLL